jgi:hypothetical protein
MLSIYLFDYSLAAHATLDRLMLAGQRTLHHHSGGIIV